MLPAPLSRMASFLSTFLERFLDSQNCLFCKASSIRIKTVRENRGPFAELEGYLCRACVGKLVFDTGSWQTVPESRLQYINIFHYEGKIKEALLGLKFQEERIFAELFALFAAFKIESMDYYPSAIVPLPLPPSRLRERGYNQSEEIARALGRRLGIRVVRDLLIKREGTRPQTEMRSFLARRENVKGAFSLQISEENRYLSGRPLLLLDDILTSGATVKEAGKALEKGGFPVRIMTIARQGFNK